ncbi:hypothetical protein EJB05_25380 [Eragrostis curvula]|uniref:Uncharacterized protein n=1 Tax=Eragrostis curvula TaxID=38414 RepID=A0A5J9VC77_9POAL|nr:hypothetical protein EJB05_25380 [Eragrostis curvula]
MALSLKLRAILFPFQMEPRREELLHELGVMWDEIGEAEDDRRGMLQALEEDCLNVYRTKVEQVRQHRAQLKREIADSVAEVAAICATIGEPPTTVQTACSSLKGTGNLKEELGLIAPELAEMRRRRDERRRQFLDVTERLNRIRQEMNPSGHQPDVAVDSSDLTLSKLEELRAQLQHLQTDKESRTRKVAELRDLLRSSALVLGMDPREFIYVRGKEEQAAGDISDAAMATLASEIERLREIKRDRMQKLIELVWCGILVGMQLQDLVGSMLELWHLMDTPSEEQRKFQSVACNIAASEDEITQPGTLSIDFIHHVTRCFADAERSLILERLEAQISEARDLEFSRKDVLERMDKWQAALEEEFWLEEYNRNENRYNVGKGTHLVLKRAEKARAVVSKMPGNHKPYPLFLTNPEELEIVMQRTYTHRSMNSSLLGPKNARVDSLANAMQEGLLDMLEEYSNTRKEKEHERKRQRDQRRLQGPGERDASPVARPPPKNIKNVTRTLSMGGSAGTGRKASGVSSRPSTPSFLKSPMSARRGGSDEGQLLSDSFE